jgi:hypothetical protein
MVIKVGYYENSRIISLNFYLVTNIKMVGNLPAVMNATNKGGMGGAPKEVPRARISLPINRRKSMMIVSKV